MISLPAHTFISAKGTEYEGNDVLAFICGERKYYVPAYGLLFIRRDDDTYVTQPHSDAYYDAVWEKYFAHMPEVVSKAMYAVCSAISKSFNQTV